MESSTPARGFTHALLLCRPQGAQLIESLSGIEGTAVVKVEAFTTLLIHESYVQFARWGLPAPTRALCGAPSSSCCRQLAALLASAMGAHWGPWLASGASLGQA